MANVISKLGSKKHKQAVNRAKSKAKRVQAANSETTRLNKVGDRRGMTDSARPQHFKPGNPWRFKPGQSGNPNGAPKTLSGAYRKWLEQDDPDSGMTNAMLIAESAGEDAINGDNAARREIRQATEGDIVRWGDKELLDYIMGDSSAAPMIGESENADSDNQPDASPPVGDSRSQTAGLTDTATGH